MKYCSKCGHDNKPDSKYCNHCGTKLKGEHNDKIKTPNGNKWIIFLVIIIILLVVSIGLILGVKSSKSENRGISVKTAKVSKRKGKSQVLKSDSQNTVNSDNTATNLKVSDLSTPELMSAAVALYGGKNISNSLWTVFKDPSFVGSQISITTAQEQNVSQEGNGNFYSFSIDPHDTGMGSGGGIGYILSNDGNEIYFYQIGVSPDNKIPPKLEASVSDVVNWINQNHKADVVRDLANRLYVK